MSGRESADTGENDASHREKKKYPCTYSDGMNARKVGRIVPDGRGRSVCPWGEKCFLLTCRAWTQRG